MCVYVCVCVCGWVDVGVCVDLSTSRLKLTSPVVEGASFASVKKGDGTLGFWDHSLNQINHVYLQIYTYICL